MTRKYTHELNEEVQAFSGWYTLHKEERIEHMGMEFLYIVGDGVVESSCCGSGSCRYAFVPGCIVEWKTRRNEDGLFTSLVKPIRDEKLQGELRKLIKSKEGITQIQFW